MQGIFEGKLWHDLKSKSNWGDLIGTWKDILTGGKGTNFWNMSNTKNQRPGRDLDQDLGYISKNRGNKITKESLMKDRRIPASEIDKLWEALHKDEILINKGSYSEVNPKFAGSLDKAIKEVETARSVEVPPEVPVGSAPVPAVPSAGSSPSPVPAPTPSAAPEAESKRKKDPLTPEDVDRFIANMTDKHGYPEAAIKAHPEYRRILNYIKKNRPDFEITKEPNARGEVYYYMRKIKKPKKSASISELAPLIQAETNRLLLLHRASLISPRVKSPLDDEA